VSDLSGLVFEDPNDHADGYWRVVLYASPGQGKTVGACSAPAPILAVSADRPRAYDFARRHYRGKRIDVARFTGVQTLRDVRDLIRAQQAAKGEEQYRTVVLDPFRAIYDQLVRDHTTSGGKPNYQRVNERVMEIVDAFRTLPINLVIVTHEKRTDEGDNSDVEQKVFPHLGGPTLIEKIMGEMDVVARVFRRADSETGEETFNGQLVDARGYVCKDTTPVGLGRTRVLDLEEWFAAADAPDDESDLPWNDDAGGDDAAPEDVPRAEDGEPEQQGTLA
jgi:hypothetical protein